MDVKNKNQILVAPLDWGLGHATRCIPIISYLLKKNISVIIAADGRAYDLLKKEFPSLEFIRLAGYNITYSEKGKNLPWKLLWQLPKLIYGVMREHALLKKTVRERKIDVVISDNRYGLWCRHVYSIFITHQINIPSPIFKNLVNKVNRWFINKYDQCWIPDNAGENNLSGDLSHGVSLPPNTSYIGVLSRFTKTENVLSYKYDLVVTLSGPEPQRSILEEQLINKFKNEKIKTIVVRGLTETNTREKVNDYLELVDSCTSAELSEIITNSEFVLSRSGYSSMMDMAVLQKKSIVIPTPGQTEQEYLATYLSEKGLVYSLNQEEINRLNWEAIKHQLKPLSIEYDEVYIPLLRRLIED